MKRDKFWSLVEETRSGTDPSEHANAIETVLAKLPAADIFAFEQLMADLLASSYTWELWGAAYIINGGCSDDGFDYFRGWLILQGEHVFTTALAEPDSLADTPEIDEEVECEDILYAARSAYQSVTGIEIPSVPINLPTLVEGWNFDDDLEMKERYPKLFARFCDAESD